MVDRHEFRSTAMRTIPPFVFFGGDSPPMAPGERLLSHSEAMTIFRCATRLLDENVPLSALDPQPYSVKLIEVVVRSVLSVMLHVIPQTEASRYTFTHFRTSKHSVGGFGLHQTLRG